MAGSVRPVMVVSIVMLTVHLGRDHYKNNVIAGACSLSLPPATILPTGNLDQEKPHGALNL